MADQSSGSYNSAGWYSGGQGGQVPQGGTAPLAPSEADVGGPSASGAVGTSGGDSASGAHQSQSVYGQQPFNRTASSQSPYAADYAQTHSSYGRPNAPAGAASAPARSGHVFLKGFLGALCACILAFAGFGLVNGITNNGVAPAKPVVIGAKESSTIEANEDSTTLAETVAQKALPSVACIYVYSAQQQFSGIFGNGGRDAGDGELVESSLGSGIVLSEDGYILTNYHVVEGADALKVNVGGSEYDAEIVGADQSSDLAVIKASGASGLTAADIGDSDTLSIGEWVMSIGSPFGLEQSVATGVVSATSRSQIVEGGNEDTPYGYNFRQQPAAPTIYPNMIQTDAAINPGNSGGALVDANGKVIGVNTLITSYSGNYSGVGFAIPINYAIHLAKQIIAGETPTHAKLGVSLSTVNEQIAKRYGLATNEGAYVASVSAGSGAEKAGMNEGDIVVAADGNSIASASDLMLAVRGHNPGDAITLTVNREGQTKDIEVTLGSDGDSSPAPAAASRSSYDGVANGAASAA